AWEERKLGELGKTQSGIGFPDAEQGGSEGIPFFKVSDMNNIGNEYEMRNANHYVSNEQIERKKWKPIEDVPAIIFAKVGAAIMLNRKRLVTSPFLIDNNTMAYLFNNTWDIYFGKILFETINLPRYSQVGALPSYNSSDIENISVKVPVKDEQQKIGNFFKQLDDTIALHQRKLDLLKETKKGFLQKMFPKNGAKVPEIRFPGFTEDWEERRLQEVVDRYDNLRIPITASKRVAGNTPYYGANGIQGYVEGYTHDGEFILVAEDGANDLKNYPVQYVDGKVWVNNHAHVIQAKENLADNMFLMNAIRSINIEPFLVGGGRAKLNADVLMKLEVIIPLKSEQQKIGTFFKQLDDTIALHQRKLDLLKETKKGFLQKMFV
ncbi:restriction endonuclease subunit S, partial [Escherichia coli]